MKTGIKIAGGVLPLLLVAVLIIACENDNTLAPSDAVITMWANPTSIPPGGAAGIFARITDKGGTPLPSVNVFFSTTGGSLGSQGPPGAPPTPVSTDDEGMARDTLVLAASDPDSVTVTALTATITKTVTLTRQGCLPAVVADAGANKTRNTVEIDECEDLTLTGNNTEPEPAGTTVQYTWDCGNGDTPTTGTSKTVTCNYCFDNPTGTTPTQVYTATFSVVVDRPDTCHLTGSDTVTITYTEPAR